jgi:hypothetical protein
LSPLFKTKTRSEERVFVLKSGNYFMGSGMVESGGKQISGLRLKRLGARMT